MKIANADKLKQHFENVVDVKLFTVPNILTIIDTFSSEVKDGDVISFSQDEKGDIICHDITKEYIAIPCSKCHRPVPYFESFSHCPFCGSLLVGGTEP